MIEKGIHAGEIDMYHENAIWVQNSSDKVDIAQELMRVVRELFRTVSLDRKLRALSIGSGSEPQFQILESAFRGELYLLDIESVPLAVIKERVKSHWIDHVTTVLADYNKTLVHHADAQRFLNEVLGGSTLDLVVLHHSLYYSSQSDWTELFNSLYNIILARKGAIHAVMMSSSCEEKDSTTWLYNHFAGKFFGCRNDQDLKAFGKGLHGIKNFTKAEIQQMTHRVKFYIDDFEKYMAVIWMILLYPNVHDYSYNQKKEITEYVYENFYKLQKPLIQMQDHLILSR